MLACMKGQLRGTAKERGDEEKLTRTQKESQRKMCSTKELNVSVSDHGNVDDNDGERDDKGGEER